MFSCNSTMYIENLLGGKPHCVMWYGPCFPEARTHISSVHASLKHEPFCYHPTISGSLGHPPTRGKTEESRKRCNKTWRAFSRSARSQGEKISILHRTWNHLLVWYREWDLNPHGHTSEGFSYYYSFRYCA